MLLPHLSKQGPAGGPQTSGVPLKCFTWGVNTAATCATMFCGALDLGWEIMPQSTACI